MKSKATAVWTGGLKDGIGKLTTAHKALDAVPYSFKTRFEGEPGTNPEELIAAAHAGCFSMALSKELGDAGVNVKSLETTATVTLSTEGNDIRITHVDLDLVAEVPEADQAAFDKAAETAKLNCPVSKLLNAEIRLKVSTSTVA
jgi:osmotically inducible protein OsmC